jgi:FkbM family methyltransferase
MIIEKTKSALVGSFLQRPAEAFREVLNRWRGWREPGLIDFLAEARRTSDLMRHFIRDGTNCIDVGAHLGVMTNEFLKSSPSGCHLAIEPVGYKAAWLQKKFPKVQVLAAAASDFSGTTEFEMIEGRGSADSGLKAGAVGRAVRHVKVDCHRLDDVVSPQVPIGFIKIDVIGAELRVLRGARELLMRDRPVLLFECTQSSTSAMGVDPSELFHIVSVELDYDVYSLKGWALRHEPLDLQRFLAAQFFPFEAFNFVGLPRTVRAAKSALSVDTRLRA